MLGLRVSSSPNLEEVEPSPSSITPEAESMRLHALVSEIVTVWPGVALKDIVYQLPDEVMMEFWLLILPLRRISG